jgi:ferritin-like metal-binding protein YciE/predicted ester cyclase
MATNSPFLTNWVKNCYSMEMGLVSVLEQQTQQIHNDPELRQGLDHHLQQTRQHADLLKGCLLRMNENVSGIQPTNPMATMYAKADEVDATFQIELIDFVTEIFEAASYKALSALAQQMGDPETARICQQILRDETAISRALDQRLPQTRPEQSELSSAMQENIKVAHATINALNAHDTDKFDQLEHDNIRVETPGAQGAFNKQQYHDYLQDFLVAFPDLHFDIMQTVCQDDTVVLNWTATGTQRGPLRSPQGASIPPTNAQVKMMGSSTIELKHGKALRTYVFFDNAALLSQLGMTPRP